MEKEIWKQHSDFRDFEFSNHGNFRNVKTGKIMKNSLDGGYVVTFLYCYSKQKRVRVRIHRIIAELFLEKSQNPNKNHVNHIDGVKNNNLFTNLEWTTNQENIQHSIDTGLRKRSSRQKLNEDKVRTIRNLFNDTDINLTQLSKMYDMSDASILRVLKYKTWFNVDIEKKYEYNINKLTGVDLFNFYKKKQNCQNMPLSNFLR